MDLTEGEVDVLLRRKIGGVVLLLSLLGFARPRFVISPNTSVLCGVTPTPRMPSLPSSSSTCSSLMFRRLTLLLGEDLTTMLRGLLLFSSELCTSFGLSADGTQSLGGGGGGDRSGLFASEKEKDLAGAEEKGEERGELEFIAAFPKFACRIPQPLEPLPIMVLFQ